MKILVDKIPETAKNCPFSTWVPNPPFIEEPGYYECKISNKGCDLSKLGCHFFKECTKES